MGRHKFFVGAGLIGILSGCAVVEGTYDVISSTVKGAYYVTTGTVT
ncbi:MAG: septal ring lytic transglycosylase RlpA family protein, partial [Nitrospinaceae bacterium]|nr:septal ring lytic transglycosylase RlpA family protein [Nitrospinaceae bacterium]